MKQREIFGRRQWSHDARLQDAVTADHAATAGTKRRLILWVRGNANQLAQATRGELRIAIERHDVGSVCRNARRFAKTQEGVKAAFSQRGDQQLQFAALAFPPDPALLGLAETSHPVQDKEARRIANGRWVAVIESTYLLARVAQQPMIGRDMFAICIGPVA